MEFFIEKGKTELHKVTSEGKGKVFEARGAGQKKEDLQPVDKKEITTSHQLNATPSRSRPIL
jgi:hypothetical protein